MRSHSSSSNSAHKTHSSFADPWGTVVAQASDEFLSASQNEEDAGTFAMADINLDWVEKIRLEMPLWEQRRLDVYPALD